MIRQYHIKDMARAEGSAVGVGRVSVVRSSYGAESYGWFWDGIVYRRFVSIAMGGVQQGLGG